MNQGMKQKFAIVKANTSGQYSTFENGYNLAK
jgi:hypothetical protein